MSLCVKQSQSRILLQENLVVAIVRVHCLMESGLNKFDDLSGASEPAKFDRKTLIDSTLCTEENVNVQSRDIGIHRATRNSGRRNGTLFATITKTSQTEPTEAGPEVHYSQRRKDPAFTTST